MLPTEVAGYREAYNILCASRCRIPCHGSRWWRFRLVWEAPSKPKRLSALGSTWLPSARPMPIHPRRECKCLNPFTDSIFQRTSSVPHLCADARASVPVSRGRSFARHIQTLSGCHDRSDRLQMGTEYVVPIWRSLQATGAAGVASDLCRKRLSEALSKMPPTVFPMPRIP